MCTLQNKKDGDEVKKIDHLTVMSHSNGYGVCEDKNLELYYFCKLDVHLKPITLWDGDFDAVSEAWRVYCKHGKLHLEYLDVSQGNGIAF